MAGITDSDGREMCALEASLIWAKATGPDSTACPPFMEALHMIHLHGVTRIALFLDRGNDPPANKLGRRGNA